MMIIGLIQDNNNTNPVISDVHLMISGDHRCREDKAFVVRHDACCGKLILVEN